METILVHIRGCTCPKIIMDEQMKGILFGLSKMDINCLVHGEKAILDSFLPIPSVYRMTILGNKIISNNCSCEKPVNSLEDSNLCRRCGKQFNNKNKEVIKDERN